MLARVSVNDELGRRRALIRDAIRYSSFAGALICVALVLAGTTELAISVAVGTALGVVNFVLLSRGVATAIDRTVAAVEQTQRARPEPGVSVEPEEVVGRPRGAGGALRLILVVIVLAAALAYPPTQPLGLAVGVLVVLVAASVSGLRHARGG